MCRRFTATVAFDVQAERFGIAEEERPFPADRMEAFPVSTLVSSPGNEGRELLEPVPVEGG